VATSFLYSILEPAPATAGAFALLLSACSPVANPILGSAGSPLADATSDDRTDAPEEAEASSEVDVLASDAPIDAPDEGISLNPDAGGPSCGNGNREGSEVCDDYGNPTSGWGCNDTCTAVLTAVCGDGVVTSPEVCDGLSSYCDGCKKILGSCGDGILQSPEECDSKGESATCDADCTKVVCGDRIVNRAAKEACDDGLNDGAPGSCTADCSDYVMKASEAKFKSCKDLLAATQADGGFVRTGFYWLRTAKDDGSYIAYCDMTSDGGGFTLVMRAIDSNYNYNDSHWSTTTLENDKSFDFVTRHTRSKYRAFVEVKFDELRTSEVDDISVGYTVAITQDNALALFGFNNGSGVGLQIAAGADALEPYFNDRADPDNRQWGCAQYTNVGLNQHDFLHVKDHDSNSLGPNRPARCDWDGGARFGQRVNACRYSIPNHQCSGNHHGQGWGNFRNSTWTADPIRQLLWVR
jgi:cysteine-rich repeat protein